MKERNDFFLFCDLGENRTHILNFEDSYSNPLNYKTFEEKVRLELTKRFITVLPIFKIGSSSSQIFSICDSRRIWIFIFGFVDRYPIQLDDGIIRGER